MANVTIIRPSTGKTYTITTDHAASSYGIPIVLEDGELINFSEPRGVYYNSNASDSTGEREGSLAEEAAADMMSIRIGLGAGADNDPAKLAMIDAAWFGKSI